MSGSTSKKKWVRVSASGSEAGAGVAMTLQAPFCGWIRRARVVGPGGSNLTLNVSETLAGSGSFDIVLAYGSAATPIDEEEMPAKDLPCIEFPSHAFPTLVGERSSGEKSTRK